MTKTKVHSVDEAQADLESLIDRMLAGEVILVRGDSGNVVQFVPVTPAEVAAFEEAADALDT